MHYHTISYQTIQYLATPCNIVYYHAMKCWTMIYHTISYMPKPFPFYRVAHTIQYVPFNNISYQTIPYHTIPYQIVTIPDHTYHIIPQHTITWYTRTYHTMQIRQYLPFNIYCTASDPIIPIT
jgi:hypothetical protein